MNSAQQTELRFDGATFDPEQDGPRLNKQLRAVRDLMLDENWRTLRQIADTLQYPEASVSARLRDLRKPAFGSFTVDRRRVVGGIWEYRVRRSE